MRILLYIIAIGLFLSQPVSAQQLTVEADCVKASQYKAEGAEYVPGVDVNGNPVAGADIENSLETLNYPLVIPVEIDVVRFLDLDVPPEIANSGEMESDVAYFTLFEDGKVEYNGQDVSNIASVVCVDGAQTAAESAESAAEEPVATAQSPAPELTKASESAPVSQEPTKAPEPKAEPVEAPAPPAEPEAQALPTAIEPVKEVKPDGQKAANTVPSAPEKETPEKITESEFNKLINQVTENEPKPKKEE